MRIDRQGRDVTELPGLWSETDIDLLQRVYECETATVMQPTKVLADDLIDHCNRHYRGQLVFISLPDGEFFYFYPSEFATIARFESMQDTEQFPVSLAAAKFFQSKLEQMQNASPSE